MSAGEVAIVSQGGKKEREDMHANSSYRMRRLSHGPRYLRYPQTLNPALGPQNLLAQRRRNGEVRYGGRQMMRGWWSINKENEI
jgi:hypothetical protein